MSIKHLFKAVAVITIFAVITRAFGFLFRVYLSRELGAELLGIYSISLSIFSVLSCVVSSGIPVTVSRITSEYNFTNKNKKIGSLLTASIIVSIVLSVVVSVICLVFKDFFIGMLGGKLAYDILIWLLPAVLFGGIYSAVRGNLWGKKNFFGVCFTELIEQIIRIVLCFIFFSGIFGIMNKGVSAAISLSVSCFVSAIITVIYFLKSGQKFSRGKGEYLPLIKSSFPITGVRFVGSIVQPLVSVIVPMRLIAAGYSQKEAMSALGVSMGMVFPLLYLPGTLVGSLAMALVPDISEKANSSKFNKELAEKIQSSILFTLVVSFLFVPLFTSVGRQIGVVLFNNVESGILLARGSLVMVPISLCNITSSILNSLGLEVKSLKNYFLGAILMAFSVWYLPGLVGGGMALIIGMGACTLTAGVLNVIMINKRLGVKSKYIKSSFTLLAFSLLSAGLGRFICNLVLRVMPLFFSGLVGGTVSLIVFSLLLNAFGFIDISKISVKIKEHMVKSMHLKKT